MPEPVRLQHEIERGVTYESYAAQLDIKDVFYCPLKKHRGLEGWFMEHLRLAAGLTEGLPISFEARQISFSKAVPNRINAFHIHNKDIQDELWCVVEGALLVWLIDCRDGSPTLNRKYKCVLSGEQPGMLYIPSGVAHGYKAGPEGALLVYAMNSQFNPADPNEGRLPWNHFGAHLWEEDRG